MEQPIDNRLLEIQRQRVLAQKDMSIAQLLAENAQLRLQALAQQEQKILAEKNGEKTRDSARPD